jgi:two-component system chemotaxis response regulator CheY
MQKKVLIVDDAKVMRATLANMLENLGHIVVGAAENGSEAIELYKIHKPDFVTMDITMPRVNGIEDGIEAVDHIIKYDDGAKIIMVTSHGEKDKVINAVKNGASNYVLKPIDKERLKVVIDDLFQ